MNIMMIREYICGYEYPTSYNCVKMSVSQILRMLFLVITEFEKRAC